MHTGVHSGGTRNHPAFPHANGFNSVWRALPGDEFVLPPSPANGWPARPVGLLTFADLTPATGARTTRFCRTLQRRSSACRSTAHGKPALRSPLHANAAASTASRSNVRDDSRSAPHAGRDARTINVIWGNREAIYFSREGWTGIREPCPSGKSLHRKSARRACSTRIFFILP